jgi:hypothetical protein
MKTFSHRNFVQWCALLILLGLAVTLASQASGGTGDAANSGESPPPSRTAFTT